MDMRAPVRLPLRIRRPDQPPRQSLHTEPMSVLLPTHTSVVKAVGRGRVGAWPGRGLAGSGPGRIGAGTWPGPGRGRGRDVAGAGTWDDVVERRCATGLPFLPSDRYHCSSIVGASPEKAVRACLGLTDFIE
jgi:hypothetical protein